MKHCKSVKFLLNFECQAPLPQVKAIEVFLATVLLHRAGLRGLMGPIHCQGAPRDEIYLFQIKYSFEKFL